MALRTTPPEHLGSSLPKLGSPLGTLVAACLLVVSGCGNAVEGSVPTNGPLNGGTDITLTCLEDKGATDFTFGAGFVRNTGTQPVKILGVRLIRPKNFELLEQMVSASPIRLTARPSSRTQQSDWQCDVPARTSAEPGTALDRPSHPARRNRPGM